MTSRDFMDYLIYVEHGAENLQFYLWYKDYSIRFNDLPESEKVLSPPYSGASDGPEVAKPPAVLQKPNPNVPQFFKPNSGKDEQDQETHHLVSMSSMQTMRTDPFSTPPATPNDSMFPGSSVTPFDGTMNEIGM